MALEDVIERVKKNPDYSKCGMVLYHNGIVRETSRGGEPVTSLQVHVNHQRLKEVIKEQKERPGIIDIQVEIYEEKVLHPGDDVMVLAVAGDIRDNVKPVLSDTLELIKKEVTTKDEVIGTKQPE